MIAETYHEHIPEAEAMAMAIPPPPGTLTPEQIEERHTLVELHRLTAEGSQYRPSFELVRELSLMPIEEAEELLERERSSGYRSDLLEQYNAYVEDLKAIRDAQAEHLRGSLGEVVEESDPELRRHKFLEKLAFSPDLAKKTLKYINERAETRPDVSLQTSRLFSEKQIEEAAKDKVLFQQAIIQAITREPQIAIQSYDVLKIVASNDQLRVAFDTLRDSHPHILIRKEYIEKALAQYPEEERQQFLSNVCENNINSNTPSFYLLDTLCQPEIMELLGPDKAKEIATTHLAVNDIVPSTFSIEKILESGLLTREQLRQKVIGVLKDRPDDYIASQYLEGDFFTDQDKDKLRSEMLDDIRGMGVKALNNIDTFPLLSDDDKRQLIQEILEANPYESLQIMSMNVLNYVGEEIILTHVRRQLIEPRDEPLSYTGRMIFLKSEEVSIEEKKQFLDELLSHHPHSFLDTVSNGAAEYPEILMEIYGEAEIGDKIRYAILNSQFVTMHTIEKFLQYLGDETQKKEFIRVCMEQVYNPIGTIVNIKNGINQELQGIFTEEELDQQLAHALERIINGAEFTGDNNTFQSLAEVIGEERCREVLDVLLSKRPEVFLRSITGIAYLYTQEELQGIISEIAKNPEYIPHLIDSIRYKGHGKCWANYADRVTISGLIMGNLGVHTEHILHISTSLKHFLTSEDMALFARKLIEVNPAAAISAKGLEFISEYDKEATAESIIERALADQARMSVAGQYLPTLFKKIQKTESEIAQQRLIKEAIGCYQDIDLIISSGYMPTLQMLHERINPNARSERQLVDNIAVLIILESENLREIEQAQNLEEIERLVIREVGHLLDIDYQILPEQVDNLNKALGSITNFAIYLSQHKKSQPHLDVMAPFIQSLLEGRYEAWKYGDGSEESMGIMKASGLLPANLTPEQYEAWRVDTESQHEALNVVYAEAVIHEFRRILNENNHLLPEGSVIADDEYKPVTEENSLMLASYGQRIATLHGELKVLRNQPDQDMAAQQVSELETELYDLQSNFRNLQLRQDAITIFHLSLDDIGRGRIGGEKRGQNIANILQRIRKNLDEGAGFLAEQLGSVYESYQNQTGKPQVLTVVDTGNPKITIEIGAVPVGSCQHFRSGSVNRALLGYTDPNHKILMVRNERGNPVARSISRLLADNNGDPVMHIETVYSVDASDDVVKAVYKHAVRRAAAIGIPVVVSAASQNDEGQSVAARNIDGIKRNPVPMSLHSVSSRAPFVYVDSAGGAKANGFYSLQGLSVISEG